MKSVPVDLESGMIVARALRNCAVVHVADVNADPEYPGSPAQTLGGVRTVLSVPLIRETQPIGAITVSRTRVEPFTEKQIDLIKTFADQAVIAIENARLFDEVTARTEDLRESLQQQTATADVLKVISRSAFDLQTVLDTLVQSAARLADAANCFIFRREGDKFRLASSHGFTPEYREWMEQQVMSPAGIRSLEKQRSKAARFTSRTCWRTRTIRGANRSSGETFARCWVFRSCARASQSG